MRTPPPSHPELLDYLAATFVDEGWSLKRMHRLMMTSQAYRQASDARAESAGDAAAARGAQVDPENRLLWRMNRRRLELEAMRDSLLMVAGRLDLQEFGRSVDIWQQPYSTRRTIYGYIDRQDLPGIFGIFDFANPDVTIDQRPRTTVPQQALFAMNSAFVQEQTRKLAARKEIADEKDPALRLAAIFRTALGREPSVAESQRFLYFIAGANATEPSTAAWQYGVGEVDLVGNVVKNFAPFKHWTGVAWQAAQKYPDTTTSHAILRKNSGHAGPNLKHAVVSRWTAPQDGVVVFDGELKHGRKDGDGVALHLLGPNGGKLGSWVAYNGTAKTVVARIEVRRGDRFDLVIDARKTHDYDGFEWSPSFTLLDAPKPMLWNFQADFSGPKPAQMSPWELAAQVLLMSNEFMFVD